MKFFYFVAFCLMIICEVNGEDSDNRKNFIASISLFFLSLVICLSVAYIVKAVVYPSEEPEESQVSLVMSSQKTYQIHYVILFRIGCPTDNFDFKRTTIDIELFGPKREQIGAMVRFQTQRLTDPVDSYLKINMGRLTPMPHIEAIGVRHSGRADTKIFLFWLRVIEIEEKTGAEKERQLMKIFEYVHNYNKIILNNPERQIRYPPTPTPRLEFWETLIIIFFITCAIALIAVWSQIIIDESWGQQKCNEWVIAVSTAITILPPLIALVIYEVGYKRILKDYSYKDKCVNTKSSSKWDRILCVFNCVLVGSGLTLAVFSFVIVQHRDPLWTYQEWCWFATTSISMTIVFTLWFVVTRLVPAKKHRITEESYQSKSYDSYKSMSDKIKTVKGEDKADPAISKSSSTLEKSSSHSTKV